MLTRYLSVAIGAAVVFVVATGGCPTASGAAGGTYEAWTRHRDAVLQRPRVVRYYTFESGTGAPDDAIPNLAGQEGALSYSVAGQIGEPLERIEGRWPQKRVTRQSHRIDFVVAHSM